MMFERILGECAYLDNEHITLCSCLYVCYIYARAGPSGEMYQIRLHEA